MSAPLNALVLGGCLLRRPLRAVPDLETKLEQRGFGEPRVVHSLSEMFQFIEFLKGEKDVPRHIRRLTGISPKLQPMQSAAGFRDIDIALIEVGSPVEISFQGIAINRTQIMREVLAPIEQQGKIAAKLCQKWLRSGILEMDEEVRAKTGAKLIELVPDDDDRAFRRAVLAETHAVKSDIADGFGKMRDLLHCPLGAAIFVFRYMPDGRPISWPAGSREEAITAAKENDIPFFDPIGMVQDYGAAAALEEDFRHYTEEFLPVIGEAIVEFARSVYARSRAPAPN
jgi:hypothetical protein